MLAAALLFWLPLIMIPIGVVVALSRKDGLRPIFGSMVSIISGALVMFSWLTIPESDSSAGGHLMLSIVGPSILMAIGCFLAIFSGKIPVQRLPSYAGPVGFCTVLLGLIWLAMLHISNPPIWRHEVNPYWLIWWPTFLFSVFLLSSFVISAMLMVGENRSKEAGLMGFFSFIFFIGLMVVLQIDGELTDAEQMRTQLWLAIADAFGTTLGIVMAILTVAFVVAQYEKRLPEPEMIDSLDDYEKEQIKKIIQNNTGGGNS